MLASASGSGILTTLGFARVDIIKKNKRRKNMMSLMAPLAIST
jgi:hypothetical protein